MGNQKSLKDRRREAADLVLDISAQLEKAEVNIQKSIIELKDATKAKVKFQQLIPTINRLINDSKKTIEDFKKERTRINRLIKTIDNFYSKKYEPLVEKIIDSNNGFKARIQQGDKFNRDIQKMRLDLSKQFALVKGLVNDSKKKLANANKIESLITKIYNQVIDDKSTIKENRRLVEEASLKIEAAAKNISEIEGNVIEKERSINELFTKSELASEQINNWLNEAEDTLVKIKKIYEIAADTGLGGEFDKRRKSLNKDLVDYREHLFYTAIALLVMIIGLFILQLMPESVNWDATKLKFDANFYARFLLTSPIIFYLTFVTAQFNKTKALLERYSFKTALALSIDAHINLLINIEKFQSPEHIDLIARFIMDGFKKIYSEPYQKEEFIKSKGVLSEILDTLNKMKPNIS